MILDETMTLRFSVSSGADVVFHSSYVTDTGTAITAAALVGESNGATAVVLAAAPGAGALRTLESATLYNAGTATQSTTVTTSDGLIARPLIGLPNPIVNVGVVGNIEPDPGICVWDDPAILHCYQSSATTATTLSGTLQFVDRA